MCIERKRVLTFNTPITAALRTYAEISVKHFCNGCVTYSMMDSKRREQRERKAKPRINGSSLSLKKRPTEKENERK